MVRLFTLFSLATALIVPMGCAGPASRWTRDSGEDRANANPDEVHARAGSEALTADAAIDRPAVAEQTSAPKRDKDRSGGNAAATTERKHESAASKSPPRPIATSSAAEEVAPDPLAESIRALGFDDPAEEASAIAALRAAPAAHREFLLRTMRASTTMRRRDDASMHSPTSSVTAQVRNGDKRARYGNESDDSRYAPRGEPQDVLQTAAFHSAPDTGANALVTIEAQPANELPKVAGRLQKRPVVQAAHTESSAVGGWQLEADRTIAAMEKELGHLQGEDRAMLEARLRLLYVIVGKRDDALRSGRAEAANEEEFWNKELYGLSILLDDATTRTSSQRAALASEPLRQAAERIGESGGLVLKNLHFCTEVKGYGTFVAFEQDEFRLGQEVLLYCEVENFQSKLTDRGYHTALKARYQIIDSTGNRLAEKDLGLKDEHCQNRRRDFFVPYFLWMPKQVPSGKYQLKLTVEDVHSATTAEATIAFAIKDR
jgi:hypothetical protein